MRNGERRWRSWKGRGGIPGRKDEGRWEWERWKRRWRNRAQVQAVKTKDDADRNALRGCGWSKRYIPHSPGKYFLFVRYLPRPLTPHDEQDSEPLNKLNRITVLRLKRTNCTGTIHWPHHPHRLILPWSGPGGDVWTKLAKTLRVGDASRRVFLRLRT